MARFACSAAKIVPATWRRLRASCGLLVDLAAVFDGGAACGDGGQHALLAVAVRGDRTVRASGFLHDRAEFGVAEPPVAGIVQFGHDAARGAHLDHACALAQLQPGRLQALVDAVGENLHSVGAARIADRM